MKEDLNNIILSLKNGLKEKDEYIKILEKELREADLRCKEFDKYYNEYS